MRAEITVNKLPWWRRAWWFLFATRKRWRLETPSGGRIWYTVTGFDWTPDEVADEHRKLEEIAAVNGWRITEVPAEVASALNGGV